MLRKVIFCLLLCAVTASAEIIINDGQLIMSSRGFTIPPGAVAPAALPQTSAIACNYPFTDAVPLDDVSGNTNTLTDPGGANEPILTNNYAQFGGNDYLISGTNVFQSFAIPETCQVYTVAYWIQIADGGNDFIVTFDKAVNTSKNGAWNSRLLFDTNLTDVTLFNWPLVLDTVRNHWWTNGWVGALTSGWHHVAFAYDIGAPSRSLYVDGVLINANADGGMTAGDKFSAVTAASEAKVIIGVGYQTTYGMIGLLDDVIVWADVKLSDAEVAQVYAVGRSE